MRRTRSSRNPQAALKDVKDTILPTRDYDDPFWPTFSEATAGYPPGPATTSSVFRHPWYHHPLHPVDDDEEHLRKLLAGGKTRLKDGILPLEESAEEDMSSPFSSLRPPGEQVGDNSIAIVVRPEKMRLPPILTPLDVYYARRKSDWNRKHEGMQRDRKGKGKANVGDEDMAVEEKPEAIPHEKVIRASNRYAAKKAGRSIGVRDTSWRGIGYWGEKMKFEGRGKELGMIDANK